MSKKLNRLKMLRKLGQDSKIQLEKPTIEKNDGYVPSPLGKALELTEEEYQEFSFLDQYGQFQANLTQSEVLFYVDELRKNATKELNEEFFETGKTRLLRVILDRFMLGGIMGRLDQDGGNVDTIHNVRDGVYATTEAKEQYDSMEPYDSHKYHSHSEYKRINKETSQQLKEGTLKDAYTGKTFSEGDRKDLDHVISAKEVHDDPGRVLAGLEGTDLANTASNLKPTHMSINRSKKQDSVEDFLTRTVSNQEQREKNIQELEQKEVLTHQEEQRLNKLHTLENVDEERMRQIDQEARAEYENTIAETYYTSPEFVSNLSQKALQQGAQMGTRQLVGVFLVEAVGASFDEIKDYCVSGRTQGSHWWEDLQARLLRVLTKVKNKWKDALDSFKQGTISGILSNLVTVIINALVTTSKNAVRLIREGFWSIVRAFKLLMTNPQSLAKEELYHEAGKLLITGMILSISILFEQAIDSSVPMVFIRGIPIVGELIADVILGLMTGLAGALAIWGWDKLDLFGANELRIHEHVMSMLNEDQTKLMQKREEELKLLCGEDIQRYQNLIAELTF